MKIVPIHTKDIEKLREFAMETYSAAFASKNKPGVLETYYESAFAKAELLQQLTNPLSHWYFAQEKNVLLGYLKLNVEKAQTEYQDPEGMEIERIYTAPSYLRKGIGSLLINFAISKAVQWEKKYIWLGVWEENLEAVRFYKKHDFKITGTHDYNMIAEIQTDFIMRRNL